MVGKHMFCFHIYLLTRIFHSIMGMLEQKASFSMACLTTWLGSYPLYLVRGFPHQKMMLPDNGSATNGISQGFGSMLNAIHRNQLKKFNLDLGNLSPAHY